MSRQGDGGCKGLEAEGTARGRWVEVLCPVSRWGLDHSPVGLGLRSRGVEGRTQAVPPVCPRPVLATCLLLGCHWDRPLPKEAQAWTCRSRPIGSLWRLAGT